MPSREPPPIPPDQLFSDQKRLRLALALLRDPVVREANSKYRPWRKVRPIAREAGRDPETVWAAVKLARSAARTDFNLKSAEGRAFGISIFPALSEKLQHIDHACGGGAVVAFDSPTGLLSDPEVRKRFIIRTTMEEAIESSRLEGAATTRELAIQLLRSGRVPRTPAETMVANNYAGMQAIKGWLDRPLSAEMLCELQAIMTRGTLADGKVGRFRTTSEPVGVVDERSGEIVFSPPDARSLPERVKVLCDFANHAHTGEKFIHPLVKASILHFMVGYEHPFVDGNGRTARAVFYWHALRAGYRVFEYLTISELIRAAIAKYPQAYIDTETDDADLTYFVAFKLGVVSHALEKLVEYLHEEEEKVARSLDLVRLDAGLNLRQRLLLEHALRHPKTEYTAKSHSKSNGVTAMTARTDLESLRKKRFLNAFRIGREVQYVLSPDLPRRLGRGKK